MGSGMNSRLILRSRGLVDTGSRRAAPVNKKNKHLIAAAIAATLAVGAPTPSHAQQQYPAKPIRMLVPFSAGSLTDILARMIGQKMHENWGQQVVADNRPSAGGIVASQIAAGANPDGHTLILVSAGHAASATLYSKLPYDTVKDFAGVSQIASVSHALIVGKSLGIKSVKELIALAKSKPGRINFASPGVGSGSHINGEMFKLATAIDVVHVPYKGAPEALNDVMTGRVQFIFLAPLFVAPFIRDGRVLAIAVSTKERAPMLPDVPTAEEAGLPGFDFDQWFGLLAPAKTPRPIINQLSREVARILELPDVKQRILNGGASPKPSTPEQFDAFIRSEIEKLGKVIEASGARMN